MSRPKPIPTLPPIAQSIVPPPAPPQETPPGKWRKPAALGVVAAGALALLAAKDLGASPSPSAADGRTAAAPRFEASFDVSSFQRGNLHAHSILSDGDSPPESVFAWYRAMGYQFLALTDHNEYVDPEDHLHEMEPGFVLLPGEEVTLKTTAGAPVHVNALCARGRVGGAAPFPTVVAALEWATERIRSRDGIVLINHPNYRFAFGAVEIAAVRGAHLLEIYSRHPSVKFAGDYTHPSQERIWQDLLDAGSTLAAVAVDDMHSLGVVPTMRPLAGGAWVEVFGGETSQEAICAGLRHGRMYASSGVVLSRIAVGGDTMSIWIDDPGATVEFIGAGGGLLSAVGPRSKWFFEKDDPGPRRVSYKLQGGESLVRARITSKDGAQAWTQAYRVTR